MYFRILGDDSTTNLQINKTKQQSYKSRKLTFETRDGHASPTKPVRRISRLNLDIGKTRITYRSIRSGKHPLWFDLTWPIMIWLDLTYNGLTWLDPLGFDLTWPIVLFCNLKESLQWIGGVLSIAPLNPKSWLYFKSKNPNAFYFLARLISWPNDLNKSRKSQGKGGDGGLKALAHKVFLYFPVSVYLCLSVSSGKKTHHRHRHNRHHDQVSYPR